MAPSHGASAFDTKAFRRALGRFPTGVAVMTTTDAAGRPVGLTCNSFSSVSLDPPLVLWSLRAQSRALDAFRQSGAFAINVLADDQKALSDRFAHGEPHERFAGVDHVAGQWAVPLLRACVASFECTTFAQHAAGDHVIFIGEVKRFAFGHAGDPLVFCKGAYMAIAQSLRQPS